MNLQETQTGILIVGSGTGGVADALATQALNLGVTLNQIYNNPE